MRAVSLADVDRFTGGQLVSDHLRALVLAEVEALEEACAIAIDLTRADRVDRLHLVTVQDPGRRIPPTVACYLDNPSARARALLAGYVGRGLITEEQARASLSAYQVLDES